MTSSEKNDGQILSTLANGLQVLESLAAGRTSVRHLSGELGLARQTVYRLLRTLTALGWVERDPIDDTYRLTTTVWSIASRSFRLSDVRDTLYPMVRRLAQEHGETVHLATYERGQVTYIDKADGWQPIRSYTELGGTAPAYCVATGKMLLSMQPEGEITRVLSGPLQAHTEATVTDADVLRRELAETRERGYAVNDSEWRTGVAGLAVMVVSGPTGESVAIGFSGPQARITSRFDVLLSALRAAVARSPFIHPTAAATPDKDLEDL
ncbi:MULTISPECIES: IclR family transcriptional regulator [Streptomyces]|uniref:IclR family transcriptional regulator n=1 Tax=Streptomyces doudnae TaxID=3075536 RepID=A0ABD5ENU9_9ACTN|nr:MULTISPECIES: IclR family transcriptional regulator [unclassified Streptomyces]MDT0436367.1 IclR family transcriptional regulator [Streptomyces sp. DSM 41981]MYQ62233.1 helix-turn-helix domain-containing protein [Streptomyces sp. SID4950]SCD33207.1 transcriptional regulator, IclR family [Streptomyces sp. SolWspMP-5a-2]